MIIVKKFGGTSVRDLSARKLVIQKVNDDLKKGNKVIVVVSAIGRYPENFATDTLIDFANQNILEKEYCSKENYKKYLDLVMSQGENISSIIIAIMLDSIGIKSKPVNATKLGIITDSNYGDANVINLNSEYLNDLINQNIVPIITGFQGINEAGEITTLGRGGSDLTAVLIGKMVNADLVEIYTDVDGVMDKDPNKYEDAIKYDKISYDKLIELASNGAKVIHEKAAVAGKESGIDMYIKNTFSNDMGTFISIK